ncbi:MAG: hypothetical protein PVF17_06695 [Ignavibacteria bacterium]|jgi:hypothetical protein
MSDWLKLYAEGSAFEKRKYDLRKLELIISNYRQMIDQILPITLGQKTLTEKIKREIKYETEIRNGSLELYLQFVLEHKEELLSLFAMDGGVTISFFISKLLKSALELRRKFTTMIEKGLKVKIIINRNIYNDYTVKADFTQARIEVNNPTVLLAAQDSKLPLDRLIGGIDGKKIDMININSKETKTKLRKNDHRITGKQKQELSSDVELIGRLDMVAFTSHRGTIETAGRKYPVKWDEKIRTKIRRYADKPGIVFKVRPVIDQRRFKEDPISFHVLDCWMLQGKLDF